MKRLMAGLVLMSATAWAGEKPYADVHVRVTSTRVNAKGVRLIEASGSVLKVRFKFECSDREPLCSAPALNELYYIGVPEMNRYSCDNYLLVRSGKQLGIPVCLRDAENY